MTNPITIDAKLFAHINNDAFLSGSVALEGNQFSNTIGYLNQYLACQKAGAVSNDVLQLMKSCEDLTQIADTMSHLQQDPNQEELKRLTQNILDKIEALEGSQYLLIPGGWSNSDKPGHAMIYQFTKDKEGNLLFHIHNSGSGLEFHEKKSVGNKELYNPVLTYKIPKTALEDKASLQAIVKQLIELKIPKLHNRGNIGHEVLYKDVFQQFSHLDGEIIKSSEPTPEHWYTRGQISGTCAQHSLHQMLKAEFQNIDDYRRFIYGFKMQSLADYHEQLIQSGAIKEKKYLSQFKKAVRHNLRLLNLESESSPPTDLFSEEKKTNDLQTLRAYLAEIKGLEREEKKSAVKEEELRTNVDRSDFSFSTRPAGVTNVSQNKPSEYKSKALETPMELQGGDLLLQDLDTLLARLETLNNANEYNAALLQIEYCLHQLPLPESTDAQLLPFYSSINNEQNAMHFYQKMNKIQDLYFMCCKKAIGEENSTPSMYLTKMTFFTIFGHINYHNSIVKPPTQCFHEHFASGVMHNIATGNQDSVYLANQNPTLDTRLQKIKKLYKKSNHGLYESKSSRFYGDYYNTILNNHPQLKEALEELYKEKLKNDVNLQAYNQEISQLNLNALYYFFKCQNDPNFDPLFDKEKFTPIINQFLLQKELERGLSCYLKPGIRYSDSMFNLAFDDSNRQTLITSGVFLTNQAMLTIDETLQKTKYTSINKAIKQVFDCDTIIKYSKRNDNDTQLAPATLTERELFHLRRHADTQIALTLDYFIQNIHLLKDPAYQVYLEANLFQPDLLINKLQEENGTLFFKQFDKFILAGLSFYEKKGELTQQSLAFLRLKTQVNRYAYQYHECNFSDRIESSLQQLNASLLLTKDKSLKATLHQLRLQTLMVRYAKADTIPEAVLKDLVHSYFYSKASANPQEPMDLDSRHQFACQQLQCMQMLAKHQASLHKDLFQKIITDLGFALPSEAHMEGNYPCYTVTDANKQVLYTLNAEQGLIYNKEGLAYSNLPMDLITHPVLAKLGIKTVKSGFMSPNELTFYIEEPPIKLRIIRARDGASNYVIQKAYIGSDGQEHYFQLKDHKDKGFSANAINEIIAKTPKILEQRETLLWVNCDDTDELLITTGKENEPYLRRTLYTEKVSRRFNRWYAKFVFCGSNGELCPTSVLQNKAILSVEAPQFIPLDYDETTKNLKIQLERYQLAFNMNLETQAIAWQWQGEQYQLIDTPPALGEGIPSLQFQHADKAICILPIQRFLTTNEQQENSEYYKLTLDTSNTIAEDQMQDYLNDDKKKNVTQKQWQHSGTQKYYVYKIKDGMPVPEKPAEALYLCYLYLGANEPEKAWKMLEACDTQLGGLEGSFEELQYIEWIFNHLPYQCKDEENVTVSTPVFEACKLKALALLTQHKNLGNTFEFPPCNENAENVNTIYKKKMIQDVQSFHDSLNATLYKHYSLYQTMERDSLIGFQLQDEERKSLLDYYHDQLPEPEQGHPKAIGALGFEWVQLHLNTLKKEQAFLLAKMNPTLDEQKRIKEIQQFFQYDQLVAERQSDLDYRLINTEIPEGIIIKYIKTGYDSYQRLDSMVWFPSVSNEQTQQQAIATLAPNIDEKMFCENFGQYLAIAFDPSLDNRFKNQLMHYCKATLIANRHVPLEQARSNVPLLCNVLCRILQSPVAVLERPNFRGINSLLTYARTLPPVDIAVPQLFDRTNAILKTAAEIVETLPKYEPVQPVSVSPETADIIKNIQLFDKNFAEEAKIWRGIEARYSKEIDLSEVLPEKGKPFLKRKEFEVGSRMYEALQEMKERANGASKIDIQDLTKKVLERKTVLAEEQHNLLLELLPLANQGPEKTKLNRKWQIEIEAEQRHAFDITRLLSLYFQNNHELYKKDTGLSDENIRKLHALLAKYIAISTHLKHAERILKQTDKVQNAKGPEEYNQRVKLGQILYAENSVDPIAEPSLAVFQLYENILIRPLQLESIKHLLEEEDTVERVIMGGGKSKVLLPTWAYKNANGSNLGIIEVPRSLLRTNFVDLKKISAQLFGQTAVLFQFDRSRDHSSKKLEAIYQLFTNVMVNKNYLVTTNKAMQSLELTCLELLRTPPDPIGKDAKKIQEEKQEWEKQYHWAEKIVIMLRERGDVLIDEVHQGLSIKDKLNYTIGLPTLVNPETIKQTLLLYQFMKKVEVDKKDEHSVTFFDLVKKNRLLTNKDSVAKAFEKLTNALLSDPQSPLAPITTNRNETETRQLSDYLRNKGEVVPPFLKNLSPESRQLLDLYKKQLTRLLPYTIQRNYAEHYGPSKSLTHPPEQRAIAIPYIANQVPNERSRFQDYRETINLTIQALLIGNVPGDLLKSYLEMLQNQARHEVVKHNLASMEDSPSAKQFKAFFPDGQAIPLEAIDLEDESALKQLHERIASNESLIYDVLEKEVLCKVAIDTKILTHNAHNHVSMFKKRKGMSGSPWNASTFAHYIKFDPKNSVGVDGKIYQAFLQKTERIIGYDYTHAPKAIDSLLDKYSDDVPLRSIIDINATFKGRENLAIAQEVAEYLVTHSSKFQKPLPLQYILYFNEDDEITALPLADYPNGKPIVIGNSDLDTINSRLGCTPEARFTIYDQAHTIGADITQADNARALVMVDDKTLLSSCFQGNMRMRGLIEGAQTLDVVVPSTLADLSIEQLVAKMDAFEQLTLKEQNYTSALDELDDTIRNHVLRKILALEGEHAIEKKQELFNAFEKKFIESKEESLFEPDESIEQEFDTKTLLDAHQRALITAYIETLRKMKIEASPDEVRQLETTMKEIIERACQPGVCDEKHRSTISSAEGASVVVESEVKVEVDVKNEVLNEYFNEKLKPAPYCAWFETEDEKFFNKVHVKQYLDMNKMDVSLSVKTLEEICSSSIKGISPGFSPAIKATANFYKTYEGEDSYLNAFLKPVHVLLFRDMGDGKLECYLLSQQEAEEIYNRDALSFIDKNLWMATTQHTLLKGKAPENIQSNPEYQSIIEQVRFFNGEFSALLSSEIPLQWLTEKPKDKLNFFGQYLKSSRETVPLRIQNLHEKLARITNMFQFIISNFKINGEHFNWKEKYPHIEESEIKAAKELCNVCKNISQHWEEMTLTNDTWRSGYNLPLQCLSHLQQKIGKINALKAVVTAFPEQTLEQKETLTKTCREAAKFFPALSEFIGKDGTLNPEKSAFDLAQCLEALIAETELKPSIKLCKLLTDNWSTEKLNELNRLLEKGDKDFLSRFAELCKIACQQGNQLTFFSSKFSTNTTAAQQLLDKFVTNNALLTSLQIEPNLSLDEKRKTVAKAMLDACTDVTDNLTQKRSLSP